MAKNFYAVKRGFDKELNKEVSNLTFTDWNEVKPLVIGYDNARYKGFDTLEEAQVWLDVVDRSDAEKRSKKAVEKIKKDLSIDNDASDDKLDKAYREYERATQNLVNELKKLNFSHLETIGYIVSGVPYEVSKVYVDKE